MKWLTSKSKWVDIDTGWEIPEELRYLYIEIRKKKIYNVIKKPINGKRTKEQGTITWLIECRAAERIQGKLFE